MKEDENIHKIESKKEENKNFQEIDETLEIEKKKKEE